MKEEGVPFSLKELQINGQTLSDEGIPAPYIGKTLNALLTHCATQPQDNTPARLLKIAFGIYHGMQ
jgi:hypothetical protein